MGFWDDVKNKASGLQQGLANEVTKYKNSTFMEAAAAGCAMMARADGNVSSEEKQKFLGFIRNSDALKVFDLTKVMASFNEVLAKYEIDPDLGEAEALARIAKLKGKPEFRTMVRVVIAVGGSDDNFDANEKGVARKICREGAIDPSEFEL
jgi:tellurite resistance protein TerB